MLDKCWTTFIIYFNYYFINYWNSDIIFNLIVIIWIIFSEQNDSNPTTNSKLASIIEIAKRNCMPKDTIMNNIKTHVQKLFNISLLTQDINYLIILAIIDG